MCSRDRRVLRTHSLTKRECPITKIKAESCSLLYGSPSGNQVDGLPLVAHRVIMRAGDQHRQLGAKLWVANACFKHDVLRIPSSHHDAELEEHSSGVRLVLTGTLGISDHFSKSAQNHEKSMFVKATKDHAGDV